MSEIKNSTLKLVAFASGRGSNVESILAQIKSGEINAQMVAIISNNSKSGVLELARSNGIPDLHISERQFTSEQAFADHLLETLQAYNTDLVVLAGYMKKIPGQIVRAYPGKVLNIHPALLPSFGGKGLYGSHVHEAVLQYGARVSGATVHIVDEEYDTGPPVCQKCVPVFSNDTPETLAARVLKVEHQVYPQAIKLFADGLVTVDGRRVVIENE